MDPERGAWTGPRVVGNASWPAILGRVSWRPSSTARRNYESPGKRGRVSGGPTRVFWRLRFTDEVSRSRFLETRGEPRSREERAPSSPRVSRRMARRRRSLKLVMTHLRQITTRVALCASPGPMRLLLPPSPLGRGPIDACCVWF